MGNSHHTRRKTSYYSQSLYFTVGGRGSHVPPTSPKKKKILYSTAIYNTCHFDLKRSILGEQTTLFCLFPYIGSIRNNTDVP